LRELLNKVWDLGFEFAQLIYLLKFEWQMPIPKTTNLFVSKAKAVSWVRK